MAFTNPWYWFNANAGVNAWVEFGADNLIGFYGGATFNTKVRVGEYNTHAHLITSDMTDTDACAADHLTGLQYLTSSTVSINGAAGVDLDTVTQAQCFRIQLTDGAQSIATENTKFFAYEPDDPQDYSVAPVGLTFQCFEQGDTSWTNADGSAAALSLADQLTPAITKSWYVGCSVSPESIGLKEFTIRFVTDYY